MPECEQPGIEQAVAAESRMVGSWRIDELAVEGHDTPALLIYLDDDDYITVGPVNELGPDPNPRDKHNWRVVAHRDLELFQLCTALETRWEETIHGGAIAASGGSVPPERKDRLHLEREVIRDVLTKLKTERYPDQPEAV